MLLSEINKLSMLHALESGRYLSSHGFSFLGSVFAFAEHIRGPSRRLLRKATLCHYRYANRKNIMSEDISRFDDN